MLGLDRPTKVPRIQPEKDLSVTSDEDAPSLGMRVSRFYQDCHYISISWQEVQMCLSLISWTGIVSGSSAGMGHSGLRSKRDFVSQLTWLIAY
jgi:hypothetical protein